MKAVVWQAPGQIGLEEVADARIEQPGDAVVRLTMSAICGTDLHMVRGTMPDMVPEPCWATRVSASWRQASGGETTTWAHGRTPSQAAQWTVESVAKAGSIGIIGVYPPTVRRWPIGAAMNKNLTVKMGNCPHRAITPQLVDLVASGVSDPAQLLTQIEPIDDVIQAYQTFGTQEPGWIKVALTHVA